MGKGFDICDIDKSAPENLSNVFQEIAQCATPMKEILSMFNSSNSTEMQGYSLPNLTIDDPSQTSGKSNQMDLTEVVKDAGAIANVLGMVSTLMA